MPGGSEMRSDKEPSMPSPEQEPAKRRSQPPRREPEVRPPAKDPVPRRVIGSEPLPPEVDPQLRVEFF